MERARIFMIRSRNEEQKVQRVRLNVLQIQGMETRLHPMRRLKTEVTPDVNERIVPAVSEGEGLGVLILL